MARPSPLLAAGVSAVLLLGAACARSDETPPATTAPTTTAASATTGTSAPPGTTGSVGTSTPATKATSSTSTTTASSSSSSTTSSSRVTTSSSVALPAPGSPCTLGSFPDCIDPDGDGQGTYLVGGADCLATFPTSPGLCEDLDGDGRAGYPDSG